MMKRIESMTGREAGEAIRNRIGPVRHRRSYQGGKTRTGEPLSPHAASMAALRFGALDPQGQALHDFLQRLRPGIQLFGRSRAFFGNGRRLVRHLLHLGNGFRYLLDSAASFVCRGRSVGQIASFVGHHRQSHAAPGPDYVRPKGSRLIITTASAAFSASADKCGRAGISLIISLQKHIDNHTTGPARPDILSSGVTEPVASEIRSLLLAIGECAGRAVPNTGAVLNEKMKALQKGLAAPVTAGLLAATNKEARSELAKWADSAFSHHQAIRRELQEVLAALSTAAESVGSRDEKYAKEIGALTGRLGTIAKETDLEQLRASLVDCTNSFRLCVTKMAEDSRASVRALSTQVKEYRARLEEAERDSLTDALTGLANRRAFEKYLVSHIAGQKPFCLMLLDLDGFKQINDSLGHVAGDDLLKQFAAQLKSQFTDADLAGRLGGDEFVAVMPGSLGEASVRVDRVRKAVLGEYKVKTGKGQVKLALKASLGVAEWDRRESGLALLARADKEVYRSKRAGSSGRGANSESQTRSGPAVRQVSPDFTHVIR